MENKLLSDFFRESFKDIKPFNGVFRRLIARILLFLLVSTIIYGILIGVVYLL